MNNVNGHNLFYDTLSIFEICLTTDLVEG